MEVLDPVFEIKSKVRDYSVNVLKKHCKIENIFDDYKIIFIDSNVGIISNSNVVYIEANEHTKSWNNISKIIELFTKNNLKKNSKILIIGGGVLQDAVSFSCSIFSRGIDYDYVPTTLLSMVDSCIGGKTSINFQNYKNKIGTYYPPKKIIIDSKFLRTLNRIDVLSGAGEIFKFHLLNNNKNKFENLLQKDLVIDNEVILDCLKYKASIIQKDEFDKNERIILNYGHTFGHAIESLSEYSVPHGLAVVIGICIANRVANMLGFIETGEMESIETLARHILADFTINKEWLEFDGLKRYIAEDKKNTESRINMVLPCINKTFILHSLDILDLKNLYNSFLNDLFLTITKRENS